MERGNREGEGAEGVERFGGFSPWERTDGLVWSHTELSASPSSIC